MTDILARYQTNLQTPSDIQHHLPLLYSLAHGNVLELGTRSGVSTTALLRGVEVRGGNVVSVDLDPNCSQVAAGHPQWRFICSDSRDPELAAQVGTPIDLLLIDSDHQIDVTAAELKLWEPHVKPGGYILLHDPETFPGVRRAITEYCRERADLQVTFVLPCNGMGVIHKLPKGGV